MSYSPFCVQAKIIKLVGLKNGGRLSPINLVTFAGTQNGEYRKRDVEIFALEVGNVGKRKTVKREEKLLRIVTYKVN
jgi:hypothetical protein